MAHRPAVARAGSVPRMDSLAGKVVFITGGARGIGAETARLLVARGARVALVDIDERPLNELAAELGGNATAIVGDVVDFAAMERAAAATVDAFGRIDVCLANAGIASYGTVATIDPAMFRHVVDVNLNGVFHTVRATLEQVAVRRGYVLIVSSLAAYAPAPGLAAYNATKAGVEHLANALRLEVAHRGVAVGSAHMSWIDTALVRESRADLAFDGDPISQLPGPLGATGTVRECAEAFVAGIEGRDRRVNVPGWVGAMRWLKPALSSRPVSIVMEREAARRVPQMEAHVEKLGRFASERTSGLSARR